MNNLICGNQRPDKIAASVEEIVRNDVAAAGPIVYRIAGGDAAPASLASVLTDIGNVLGSGSTTPLLTVETDLPARAPRHSPRGCCARASAGTAAHCSSR